MLILLFIIILILTLYLYRKIKGYSLYQRQIYYINKLDPQHSSYNPILLKEYYSWLASKESDITALPLLHSLHYSYIGNWVKLTNKQIPY